MAISKRPLAGNAQTGSLEVSDPELGFKSPKSRPSQITLDDKQPWYSGWWFHDDPGFLVWFRRDWARLLTMLLLTAIPLFLDRFGHPLRTIYFTADNPNYMFPFQRQYIDTIWSAVISLAVPFAVIGLLSIFLIGSFWDSNNALMGLGWALTLATFFQMLLKILIGNPRPHFYEVCMLPPFLLGGLLTRANCLNPDEHSVSQALMSFPSGHSAAAFAGFGFLALWINAKFKVVANHQPQPLKVLWLMLPLFIAALLSLLKIVEYWHHWWDVLVGALIGSFFAWLAYRMSYASVFNYRNNHIPLRYAREATVEVGGLRLEEVPRRDFTCINSAGWKNKWSKKGEEVESGDSNQSE